MDKFQAFLDKKAKKARPLKTNSLRAAILADNAKHQLESENPDLHLTGIYGDRYLESIDSKFQALDKKVLPDYLSEAMEADIAKQRLEALKAAEEYTPHRINREVREISGSNYAIPEWMIVRDEEVENITTPEISLLTFPKQFHTPTPPNLSINTLIESCKDPYRANFSEPKLQGFSNCEPTIAHFPIDPEKTPKGFFSNYMEAARLCSSNPFYAWAEAQNRDHHPIAMLTNRGKKLDPIFRMGRTYSPYPVEFGGVTYFCDGKVAEEMYFRLGVSHRKLFLQCCIVAACRPEYSPEEIVNTNVEIGLFTEQELPEPIAPGEVDNPQSLMKKCKEILYDLSDAQLDSICQAGLISKSDARSIKDSRTVAAFLPKPSSFLYLLPDERRQEAVALHYQALKDAKDEITRVLGEGWDGLKTLVLNCETSLFDEMSDEEGGFNLFGEEEEEAEEQDEVNSADSNSLEGEEETPVNEVIGNFGDAEAPDVPREDLKWDPRFISEVRLWPIPYKYWEPP